MSLNSLEICISSEIAWERHNENPLSWSCVSRHHRVFSLRGASSHTTTAQTWEGCLGQLGKHWTQTQIHKILFNWTATVKTSRLPHPGNIPIYWCIWVEQPGYMWRSSSTMEVLGTELRFSGLVTGTFPIPSNAEYLLNFPLWNIITKTQLPLYLFPHPSLQ